MSEPSKSPAAEWRDKTKQKRCELCGRLAYWDKSLEEWRLRCVMWDDYMGAYEHA